MTEVVSEESPSQPDPGIKAPAARGRLKRGLRWLFPPLNQWREVRNPLLGCLLSGLSGALIFPPVEAGWLAHVALVPFLLALPHLRGSLVLWGTLLFSSVFAYLNLWWLNTLVVFHPAIPAGILLLGVIVGLFAMPFGLAARWVMLRTPGWFVPWGVAAAWTGPEFIRSLGDTAFPWNLLGHSQISGPTAMFAQWAELGGVPMVSFLVALTNGLVAQGLRRAWELRRGPQPLDAAGVEELRRLRPLDDPDPQMLSRGLYQRRATIAVLDFLWTAVAVFFFLFTAMGMELRTIRHQEFRVGQPGGRTLQVGLIQTNINMLEKTRTYDMETRREARTEVGRQYVNEALRLGAEVALTSPTPQLLVFPEAMFVDPFFVYDTSLHAVMQDFARTVKADVLFGADGWEDLDQYRKRLARGRVVPKPEDPLPTHRMPELVWEKADDGTSVGVVPLDRLARFVSVYQVKPETGLVPRVYHKMQLVPFGEHAPLLDWLPFNLAERLLWVAAFQKGTEINQFEADGVRIGTLICFESTFGSLARDHARAGAKILAVMTNDGWYDPKYALGEGGLIGGLFRVPGLAGLSRPGPDQHLIHSRFRAIETRLPVIRAANRGRTTLILPTGQFAPGAEPMPFGVRGTLSVQVPIPVDEDYNFARRRVQGRRVSQLQKISTLTPYVRYGDWAGWSSLALVAGLLGWVAVFRRNELLGP